MKSTTRWLALHLLVLTSFVSQGQQTADIPQASGSKPASVSAHDEKSVRDGAFDSAPKGRQPSWSSQLGDLFRDQKAIVTSPAHIRWSDATWLVPIGGITAGLFVTDRQHSASLSQDPTTLRHYRNFSNVGVASLVGAGAGLYLFSYPTHNVRWRETGLLAGEAAVQTLITTEGLKYALARERPYQGNGDGPFFHGGTSFPSEHAAAAWSIAGVIAHEYPGPVTKILAYGMASAVSFSRVRSRDHFRSDVFVGSVLGYLIAGSVYRRHHDPEVGGGAWESPQEFATEPKMRTPGFMGSPYVQLDSWVYAAMERLSALGYLKTQSLGIRPWTRLECARLMNEAAILNADSDGPPEVQNLIQALAEEFAADSERMSGRQNLHSQLESVYERSMGITGTPLTDGFHFGQTVLNDYGRPVQQGFNMVAGTSFWAAAGPFVLYARGEYQYAPSAPAPSGAVLGFISAADNLPANAPSVPIATTNRLRPLDIYVGMNVANWQMSFGRQSLWWGPSAGGTMAFSDNAQPVNMFRLNRVSPFRLPWIFNYLGDIRLDSFLGHVTGQQFINNTGLGTVAQGQYGKNLNPQPYLSGFRISFKFTQNFEFSMSKTTLYGGPGNPLTLKTFLQSSFGVHVNGEALGDGRSVADFSYRIPKLRNWATLYGEGFTEDEISPLPYPRKSALQGGVYFAQVPRIPKLDVRLEGGTTSPVDFPNCNGCFYHNFQYVNGFTNDGQLMGSWIGRAAQGEAISSTYWLSATRKIGIEMRHRKIDREFLPLGGTQNDVRVSPDFLFRSGLRLSGIFQYERWTIPLLSKAPQSNLTAGFEIGYWPKATR